MIFEVGPEIILKNNKFRVAQIYVTTEIILFNNSSSPTLHFLIVGDTNVFSCMQLWNEELRRWV